MKRHYMNLNELKAFIKLLKKLDHRQKEELLRHISRMQETWGCKDDSGPTYSHSDIKAESDR